MYDDEGHGCGSVGRWVGVLCAALGVVTASLMIGLMGLGWFEFFKSPPILIGLIALFIAAGTLGTGAGVFLCGKGNHLGWNILVGIGLAFASINIGVLVGGFSTILMTAGNMPNAGLSILVIALLIMLYGLVPAVLLGVLYGVLVRNRLRKLGRYSIK